VTKTPTGGTGPRDHAQTRRRRDRNYFGLGWTPRRSARVLTFDLDSRIDLWFTGGTVTSSRGGLSVDAA
jgi:hypothetical protein